MNNQINETSKEFTISDILESFKIFDDTYKREQIDAAIGLKEEITPHLIKILENVLADPEIYVEDENLYDHIYAVMLLGHFKEPRAHQVIIDLFSLSDDLPDKLFGDICTTDLPIILLNTCGGAIESVQAMVLNREADDYCRLSACHALVYAVIEGFVSREAIIAFFNTLFTGEEADEISDFWGLLACHVCDLYPEESMDVIRQAYEDELIMPGFVSYTEFENTLARGKEKCLENLKRDLENDSLDDIHARMSWWACFNEEAEDFSSSVMKDDVFSNYSNKNTGKSQKPKKKNKKKKRKQANASKKKNRR